MITKRNLLSMLALAPVLAAGSALSEPASGAKIILTVTGEIAKPNATGGTAEFSLAMLDALPQTRFRTATIWTSGVSEFSGVALHTLLEVVGARGSMLHMTALNEYAADIPVADAVPGGPILATRKDGTPLAIRDNGPVWMIYPFDDNPAYKTEVTYSRSIWQLTTIEVED